MASLIPWLKFAGARTNLGATVASGTAEFFVPGSSSVYADVWQDSIGSIDLTQPVALNAAGQAEVWTSAPCDIVIKDSLGTQVSFVASEAFGGNSASGDQVELVSNYFTGQHGVDYDVGLPVPLSTVVDRIGASIGKDGQYKESSTTGAVARDVHAVLAGMCVTPYDFGANGGGTADDTIPLQRAIDRAGALGVPCYLGAGIYRITYGITISTESHIIGAGKGKSVVLSTSSAFTMFSVSCAAGRRSGERFAWSMRDFSIEAPTAGISNNFGILVNADTGALAGGGATIERVDVTAGLGIDASVAAQVRVTDCNIKVQQTTSPAIGIDLGPWGHASNCIVDGVSFSGSNVSTGIKLSFYATAERCLVKNCTTGIECKAACSGAVARNCELNACGTSLYVRGNRSGAESCDSTSATVTPFKVDSSLTGVVDFRNSWTLGLSRVAGDQAVSSTTQTNITGFSVNLVSGITYDIEMNLRFTCGNTEGLKFAHDGAGSATFDTSIVPKVAYRMDNSGGYSPGVEEVEVLQSGPFPIDIAGGAISGFIAVRIVAVCTASGTYCPTFAQSTAGETAATIKRGSWMKVTTL